MEGSTSPADAALHGARIVVTGAGGFIGGHAVRRWHAAGADVLALDVSQAALAPLRRDGIRVIEADIRAVDAVRACVAGADVVVHAAAQVSEGGSLARARAINVEGTAAVSAACAAGGARRLVHLSSVMVYGFTFPAWVDESGPTSGDGNPYCQTKLESEAAALGHRGDGGLQVVVVRPGDVYGPGSVPWILRPAWLMKRGLFALPNGGRGMINPVYVDDLVDALALAAHRDVDGGVFNITDGDPVTMAAFYAPLAAAMHRPLVRLPAPVIRTAIRVVGTAARLAGRQAPATPEAVAFLQRPHGYSIERARAELGYAARVPRAEGMAASIAWLRQIGVAPAR